MGEKALVLKNSPVKLPAGIYYTIGTHFKGSKSSHLSDCVSVCLFVCLSSLSVCLSVSLSVRCFFRMHNPMVKTKTREHKCARVEAHTARQAHSIAQGMMRAYGKASS